MNSAHDKVHDRTPQSAESFDVIAIGEVLVEVATAQKLAHGIPATLGISGDALNVAAAAATAGAKVALAAVLTDDELGQAIAARVAALGISTDLLQFTAGQQGIYLTHSDPHCEREFSYARTSSVGSTLAPRHLDPALLAAAGAVVASGISCAISPTARAAVHHAAEHARRFVYDPNYRPRLTTASSAAEALADLAPHSWLITPSHPLETTTLLGAASPTAAATQLQQQGANMVAVTCGAEGVQLAPDSNQVWIPSVPAPVVVDQTGAGDAFVGTLTARLVLGDDPHWAARQAVAAASLSVGGRGGTGLIPTLEETRRHCGTLVGGQP